MANQDNLVRTLRGRDKTPIVSRYINADPVGVTWIFGKLCMVLDR